MPPEPATPLPVTAVTLLEDRAEVERRAVVDLAPGTHRLRFGPVTPLAVDRSLRAELTGPDGAVTAAATVLDARLVRRWTPPPVGDPGADASELRQRVHRLGRRLRETEAHRLRAASRLAVLEQLLDELRRDIAESVGVGTRAFERWSAELDRAYAAHRDRTEELRLVTVRSAELRTELQQAEAARDQAEEPPPVLTAFVDVVIEATAPLAATDLRLRHLVPCALWRPAYRATLLEAEPGPELELECDAIVWQRTGEDWTEARLSLSTARSTQAAEPPKLREDVLLLVDRTPEERRTIEVDLREVEIQTLGPTDSTTELDAALTLPGVDDGGEARLLLAPAPVTVRSDGRPHRVHLTAARLPARTEYACAPELSPLVSQLARFRNGTGQVLLSGPVELVRASGFVGRGELRFTAVDAEAELSFGSEDTFRVVRSVQETRDTGGLTGRTVITRTVLLHVSRFAPPGSAPVTVVLRERIPVSELAAVEVRLAKEQCDPPPSDLDADGILRYDLTLAPDARRTLTLAYELTATRAVAL